MTPDDTRHLLRRLAFTATPEVVPRLGPLAADAAVTSLVRAARAVREPAPPLFARTAWTNTALRFANTDPGADAAPRLAQTRANQANTEELRRWWVGQIVAGAAPLRENLVLFFHNTFGSSSTAVEVSHALHGCNALLRRTCLGTIPALLEQLVLDPAMMIQVGLDEHFRARVSDRPAKLILDRWTVGPGEYTDSDVEELSRALTGWALAAPRGREPAAAIDPKAPRASRRTGLVPTFNEKEFDAGAKTILGSKNMYGAVAAVSFLARHAATARRFSRLLVQHLGVEDPTGALQQRLTAVYQATNGSIEALLREVARSDQFWSEASRWSLIKSPVHLAAGACRQLHIAAPPLPAISRWLTAAGQTLFDTPSAGEGSWAGQDDWVTPPDRLAIRYQLPWVLAGQNPRTGIGPKMAEPPPLPDLPLDAALRGANLGAIGVRLDPAPGIDVADLTRQAANLGPRRAVEIVRRIMMTPNYQLA